MRQSQQQIIPLALIYYFGANTTTSSRFLFQPPTTVAYDGAETLQLSSSLLSKFVFVHANAWLADSRSVILEGWCHLITC
jgi:hypothetical protein